MPETTLRFDRRKHDRANLVRDCKLRCVERPGFALAQTTNLSLGGALVRVPASMSFAMGQRVQFALPVQGRSLVRSSELINAKVRRVVPIDHQHQAVGIQFERELVHEAALAA